MDPGPAGLDSLLLEISKLQQLRQIGLPSDLFADLAPHVLRRYRNRAAAVALSHARSVIGGRADWARSVVVLTLPIYAPAV